jgi:hypothetical protein
MAKSGGMVRPRCKACGNEDKFDFKVPNDVWANVVPAHLRNRVVCLQCFDRFASERGIEYARSLRALYFAGDRAAFEFRPVSAVTVGLG